MKTKEQRLNELYSSGLVNSIKELFSNRRDISEEYYVLMADYIDSMNEVKDQMLINPTEIARKMPELVKSIQDTNLQGIYGRTDNNRIQMEQSLNYEEKKLYFFHKLTHALQTRNENGIEQCGFYNGHNGMFLTEGATQYTAEMLYNISNGTTLRNREQPRTVRGASDRSPYSPLSEYQYNGNVLELLSKSMDLPLPQVLALAYKKDGRETLKNIYESMEGNQGKFDELMNNMEQIYSIDNLLIHGYGNQLQSQIPINITMQDGVTRFQGNMNTYKETMNKVERELVATYMENHDTEFILKNYNEIAKHLTTPELKSNFISAIQQLGREMTQQTNVINIENYRDNSRQISDTEVKMPNGYYINEYGEIIRPNREEKIEQKEIQDKFDDNNLKQNENKLSIKQIVAQFLQKHNIFMNLSFVEKYVRKQLDVLPEPNQQTRNDRPTSDRTRENFINELTNNLQYRNLPPIQRMSDPQRIAEMRRKMEQNQITNDDNVR